MPCGQNKNRRRSRTKTKENEKMRLQLSKNFLSGIVGLCILSVGMYGSLGVDSQ